MQTFRVVFAGKVWSYRNSNAQLISSDCTGCHDNGYLTTLRSLITAGHASKLVLLQGYNEMAAGFRTLDLPCWKIDDLFEPEKLCPSQSESPVLSAAVPSVPPGLTKERIRSNSATFTSLPASGGPVGPRTLLHPTQSGSQGLVWRKQVSYPLMQCTFPN